MNLTSEEKDHLKELARKAILAKFHNTPDPELEIESETLNMNCGAFVTLKTDDDLRGCIGLIVAVKPLYQTVIEMAQAAAFEDPRFRPLREPEMENLKIEISALSPLEVISDINQIEVGVHGLMIRLGRRSGLLLPQVATEYNWDRETFLEHTCMKAGLPPQTYRDPEAEIRIFSALVF